MQKDYLRRTATTTQRTSTDEARHHHIRSTYLPSLPSRSNTGGSGSIKDSAGGEVSGDRVILYIHGQFSSRAVFQSGLMFQAEHISSRPSTRTDIRSNVMLERLVHGLSPLHTA